MNEVAKRNTLFTSIHCEECLFLTVLPLKLVTFGNGRVSEQNTVIAVN